MADPVAALVAYLNSELNALSDTYSDVYGATVYGGSFQGQPPGVLVRASGGGLLASGYMPTVDARVDVRCYHHTDWQTAQLDRMIAYLLHRIDHVATDHGVIRWCRLAGGPNQLRESQTRWPVMMSAWQVYGDWLSDA